MTARARVAAIALLGMAATPLHARAQTASVRIEPEARVDAIIAHRSALQAALGADIAFSPELHLELAAGAGSSFGGGMGAGFSARGDAIVRFFVDPQHLMRWSPYGGGGIGTRYDRGPDWRAVGILVVGVNAPRWKRGIPFIEAGFGGGVRLGVGVRRVR